MQSLKTLLRDLKLLKRSSRFGLKRTNHFGLINDILLGDRILKRNVTKNGTFFEIPMSLYPILQNKYPRGDLHLSIFEDSGIITKHVAFKPTKQISYYYGLNYDHRDKLPHYWSQPRTQIPHEIKEVLKNLYDSISPYIKVSRIKKGIYSTPKTLGPLGTASSRTGLTAEQKQAAREFYITHGFHPPDYSNIKPLPNEMINNGNTGNNINGVIKKLVF